MTRSFSARLAFTIALVVAYRIGAHIPAPGVAFRSIEQCAGESGTMLGVLNLFSGGAAGQLSVMALGVMPFITASILVQLLSHLIPAWNEKRRAGGSEAAALTQYGRLLTVGLAAVQAVTLWVTVRGDSPALFSGCDSSVLSDSPAAVFSFVVTLVAMSVVLMWFGEQITERGIGQGVSLMIFAGIATGLPGSFGTAISAAGVGATALASLAILAMVIGVVFVESSQRRLLVVHERVSGGNLRSYIPFKVNLAGVLPVIYASASTSALGLLTRLLPESGAGGWVRGQFSSMTSPGYVMLYLGLVALFTLFHVALTYQPDELADDLGSRGVRIPGVLPGEPTAIYLDRALTALMIAGGAYLVAMSALPLLAAGVIGGQLAQLPFGGTAVMILVSVALETTAKAGRYWREGKSGALTWFSPSIGKVKIK